MDDINNELDDHENRIEAIENSLNTPDEDVESFETDTNQAISDLQQNSGQLTFPLTQDTIDLINSVGIGGLNGYQVITSSGTFTVPTGFTEFMIQAVGGGSSGGAVGGFSIGAGNGGGAGTYCQSLVNLISGISSVSVTIGSASGGDTSFGTSVVAPGSGSATSAVGTLQVLGEVGGNGIFISSLVVGGKGGSSLLGFGGISPVVTSGKASGLNGAGYGSGGSGAARLNEDGISAPGGTGTAGVVIISW